MEGLLNLALPAMAMVNAARNWEDKWVGCKAPHPHQFFKVVCEDEDCLLAQSSKARTFRITSPLADRFNVVGLGAFRR